MNCREFKNHIEGFLYGEGDLPPGAREHLRVCPSCRAFLGEARQVLSAASSFPPPDFSAPEKALLRARVLDAPASRAGGRFSRSRPLWLAAAAAAGLVVFIFRPLLLPGKNAAEPEDVAAVRFLAEELDSEYALVGELCAEIDKLDALFENGRADGDLV